MALTPIVQLVLIIVISTVCQILGWRTKIPAILLLLVSGIIVGPVFQWVDPVNLFGNTLIPLIELAVAIILFEGGLSLTKTEMHSVGNIVIRLVTISTFVTWGALSFLAYSILDLNGVSSLLLGSILVISGPTVVTPLLRLIGAKAPVEPVLRWEGILIDPVGVVLATLVAEVAEAGIGASTPWHIVEGMFLSLCVGSFFAFIGSQIIKYVIGRHLVPDHYDVPLTLTTLFSLVLLSNSLHEQSGLLTATLMGLFVARNKGTWVKSIYDFIGHTEMIVIGVLFVVLAARLETAYLSYFNLRLALFIIIAIVFVRPIAVFIGTWGVRLTLREKIAISALAPRGIVSAALASSLGGTLVMSGVPDMKYIVPYTFGAIIFTVGVYAVSAPFVFRILGVRRKSAGGVLFMGGGWNFSLALGKILEIEGFKVTYIDTNEGNIKKFRKFGMTCIYGNILSDTIKNEIDYDGIGNLIAFTANDEANSLAVAEFRPIFGSTKVFQLAFAKSETSYISGRILCSNDFTIDRIEELWSEGYRLYCRDISFEENKKSNDEFIIGEIEKGSLYLVGDDNLKRPAKPEKQIVFGNMIDLL